MSTHNGPAISPNLLMNFNPYDILQPQRSPQVDRLIDIGDMTLPDEVDASLLDHKTKYDLVDLFQNLYVTPDLVKCEPVTNNDIASTSSVVSHNIDFNDFLDKIESGVKIDWTKDNKETKDDNSIEMARKPKVLVPKVALDYSDSDEDLIEEILAKKNAEKRILDEINRKVDTEVVENVSNDVLKFPNVKVLNVPTDIDLNAARKKSVSDLNTKTRTPTKTVNNDFDITAELSNLNKKLNSSNVKLNPSPMKIDGQINNAFNFELIAIKKDEKVYKKKHIKRPEYQTHNFTKGADLYEKSIVLPQIMARIKERQAFIEEMNCKNRRLILDAGVKPTDYGLSNLEEVKKDKKNVSASSNDIKKSTGTDKKPNAYTTDNTWGKVNPTTLMADCNKERLKAFEQGRMFQNFVMNGK